MDVEVLTNWLADKEAEQSNVKATEEPAFKARLLTAKVRQKETRGEFWNELR
jgi:hypothetical protein